MMTLFLSLINLHVQWNPALQQFFLYDQLLTTWVKTLYWLLFNIAWDSVGVVSKRTVGPFSGTNSGTQFPLKLPWSKRSVHPQSHIASKLTIQVTVQNINDDDPFLVSHKPTCTVEPRLTAVLLMRSTGHYDHTTCTQTKKQSVVIFSVKLVKKTIIFIFALPVLEDLQDVNIFQF